MNKEGEVTWAKLVAWAGQAFFLLFFSPSFLLLVCWSTGCYYGGHPYQCLGVVTGVGRYTLPYRLKNIDEAWLLRCCLIV